jgi:predicted ester cyclase
VTTTMSVHPLVESFYSRIWNSGDERVEALLTEDISFRGSLGNAMRGRPAFLEYVRSVRGSLASYHCEIVTCVTEPPRAFARMRFSGLHVAPFRGFAPTGKPVRWEGAALFTFRDGAISEVWVLGDLAGLDQMLRRDAGG